MNAQLPTSPLAEYETASAASDLATGALHRKEQALRAELAKALKPLIAEQTRARKHEAGRRRAVRAWLKLQPPDVLAEVRSSYPRNPNAEAQCCVFAGLEAPSPENGMRTDLFTCPLHSDAKGARRGTGRLGANWTGD
jgi:hypothetical protein